MPLLDKVQTKAADNLRIIRPPVYSGTNVCVDRIAGNAWFAIVTESAIYHSIGDGEQSRAFFDRCGVPD